MAPENDGREPNSRQPDTCCLTNTVKPVQNTCCIICLGGWWRRWCSGGHFDDFIHSWKNLPSSLVKCNSTIFFTLLTKILHWKNLHVWYIKYNTLLETSGFLFSACHNKTLSDSHYILRKPRTARNFSFFNILLSRDNDLLSRYLDITKVVFSW